MEDELEKTEYKDESVCHNLLKYLQETTEKYETVKSSDFEKIIWYSKINFTIGVLDYPGFFWPV